MSDEIQVVRDVTERFARGRIDFMLTGSMAMNYYAEPRMTRDIDVVVELSRTNISQVVPLFEKDYYVSAKAVSESLAKRTMFNLIHNETVIKVDCIVRKISEYRLLEFSRRQEVRLVDFNTWIVSKEDLIISKLEWAKDSHSELQLRDVRNLLQTSHDATYLHEWTTKLGLTDLFKECLHD